MLTPNVPTSLKVQNTGCEEGIQRFFHRCPDLKGAPGSRFRTRRRATRNRTRSEQLDRLRALCWTKKTMGGARQAANGPPTTDRQTIWLRWGCHRCWSSLGDVSQGDDFYNWPAITRLPRGSPKAFPLGPRNDPSLAAGSEGNGGLTGEGGSVHGGLVISGEEQAQRQHWPVETAAVEIR